MPRRRRPCGRGASAGGVRAWRGGRQRRGLLGPWWWCCSARTPWRCRTPSPCWAAGVRRAAGPRVACGAAHATPEELRSSVHPQPVPPSPCHRARTRRA
eukprot:4731105-Prymnesium_polylepis.1